MVRILLVACLVIPMLLNAQETERYNSDDALFYRAEELFQKEQYSAAREEFARYIATCKPSNAPFYVKARYYEGMSALELYNDDGVKLLEQFLTDFPETIYRHQIYLRLGKYYYQKKKYKEAILWYEKLDKQDVPEADRNEYFFKLGYAHFQEGNFSPARDAFFEVKDSQSQYAAPATYYYAHIHYQDKSYQTALEHFERLLDDARFREVVPYYITQIYYLQGNYEKVVEFAPAIMDSMATANSTEINHLIGDAYYKIGKYDEAVPFLREYNKTAKTTREDDYQFAFALYKSAAYEEAVTYFDKVTRKKDELGQVAFYHIGECYLKLENYAYARTAFEQASFLDFDEKIQEDALYNAAILSYKLDINPYDEAIEAFELYLERYPNSNKRKDVYQYLVNVYMTTKNYEKALHSIDEIGTPDIRMKSAYQMIAFNKGVEEFTKSDYERSIASFKLVSRYPVEIELIGRANYWIADAYYQMKNYEQAIQAYRYFLANGGSLLGQLRAEAYYNIGYSYFNLNDRIQSVEAFRTYTQQTFVTDQKKLADANMRIADAFYLSSHEEPIKNDAAIEYYEKVVQANQGFSDRARFYQAKCYGFKDQRNKQLQSLLDIINNYPGSPYLVKSIFEAGIVTRNQNKDNESIRYFEQILNDHPNNILAKDALYELGVTYLRKADYEKAESYLNRVLLEYGGDEQICKYASQKMIEVYQKSGEPFKITQLAHKYPCAGITGDLQDSIYFNTAYDLFLDSNYREAIPKFIEYLDAYPEGLQKNRAVYFIAQSHYILGEEEQAYTYYLRVLEGDQRAYHETALARAAVYEYNTGNYADAILHYSRLKEEASTPQRIYAAHLGLMRCHFYLENWANSYEAAKVVFENGLAEQSEKLEAQFSKGVSLARLERYDEALEPLNYVISKTSTVLAAQSKYTLAEIYYHKGEYKTSENHIRELLKMKPAYDYWIAKALILQTRNLIQVEDLFQAEHTLNSVINNYTNQTDGILDEANELMQELMQLKDKPKDLEEKGDYIIEMEENAQEGGQNE
ncbi:tetratricopeptide repeat protein [Wandonia haliotis]|uniref:Tetratricopeptide repeat protein n=1 Tax=Wandonia haliotis TaxID=574963 RepID=A0ABN1ML02_9FLAO